MTNKCKLISQKYIYHNSDSLHIPHSYMWITERETVVIYILFYINCAFVGYN